MYKRFLKLVSVGLLSCLILAGCGSSSYISSSDTYEASSAVAMFDSYSNNKSYQSIATEEASYEVYRVEEPKELSSMMENGIENYDANLDVQNNKKDSSRKLIKTVNLSIQTKSFDTLTSSIEDIVEKNNGYLESANIDGNGYYGNYNRYANYTIRVPKENIKNILNSLDGFGVISNKSENVEDVTLHYYDMDSQKKALEVEQERLMDILEKAETVDQIIALESRLSDVRYEINNLGTNLMLLDNKVDYSTIYLNVEEVDVEVVPETKDKNVFETISENWAQNIVDLSYFFENLFVLMTSNIAVIILEILIVLGIVKIVHTKKKNKKKREEIKNKEKIANE